MRLFNLHEGSDSINSSRSVEYRKSLQDLISRIRRCDCWNTLYSLREEFNQFGLSIEQTYGRRRALCRLEEGKPVVDRVMDDFIFIEGDSGNAEIGNRSRELITDFVWRSATGPQAAPLPKGYQRSFSLYGLPVRIANESKLASEQESRVCLIME